MPLDQVATRDLPPFAAKLKAYREAAGLTQEQLAKRAGLHLGAVFKLEQGKREPAWATVQVLAAALGVTCLEFAEPVSLPAQADEPRRPRGRPPKQPAEDLQPAPKKADSGAKGRKQKPASDEPQGHEEIVLSADEEADLDAAWAKIHAEQADKPPKLRQRRPTKGE